MSLTFEIDRVKTQGVLRELAKDFGDTEKQATARYAVAIARSAAEETEAKGRSKKKQFNAIEAGARANIVPIPARDFNRMRKNPKPRFKFGNQWVTLREDQMLEDEGEISSFIERNRDDQGRVRKVGSKDRAVCKSRDMNKVIRERKKRAGMGKGGWLGAGIAAGRMQRGGERITIGKNFISWAQKHAGLGRARRRGKSILLVNRARHSRGISPRRIPRAAEIKGLRSVINFYRRSLKARERR